MTNAKQPARFGKYSKTINGLQFALQYLEKFASDEIEKRDAEIARLKERLKHFEAVAPEPTAPQVPEGMSEHNSGNAAAV